MKDRHQINREIYSKLIPGCELTYRDIKDMLRSVVLNSDDRIYLNLDEGETPEDDYLVLSAHRYTPETDEEYYKRIGEAELEKKAAAAWMKEVRRKKYLELKQEFGNEHFS